MGVIIGGEYDDVTCSFPPSDLILANDGLDQSVETSLGQIDGGNNSGVLHFFLYYQHCMLVTM